jgi:hypothetical protein
LITYITINLIILIRLIAINYTLSRLITINLINLIRLIAINLNPPIPVQDTTPLSHSLLHWLYHLSKPPQVLGLPVAGVEALG